MQRKATVRIGFDGIILFPVIYKSFIRASWVLVWIYKVQSLVYPLLCVLCLLSTTYYSTISTLGTTDFVCGLTTSDIGVRYVAAVIGVCICKNKGACSLVCYFMQPTPSYIAGSTNGPLWLMQKLR